MMTSVQKSVDSSCQVAVDDSRLADQLVHIPHTYFECSCLLIKENDS